MRKILQSKIYNSYLYTCNSEINQCLWNECICLNHTNAHNSYYIYIMLLFVTVADGLFCREIDGLLLFVTKINVF